MAKTLKQPRSIEAKNKVPNAALAARLPWMVEMLPPASLNPAKRNARAHDKAQEEAVANSVLHFGVIKPVVIDEENRIVAGHVVWRAAKKRLALCRRQYLPRRPHGQSLMQAEDDPCLRWSQSPWAPGFP